jgi:hypothetical protein
MTRKGLLILIALVVLLSAGTAWAGVPFQTVKIQLEDHAEQGDGLAVIVAETFGAGLTRLDVYAPGGRQVVAFESRNKRNLGGRMLRLETPEPYFADLLISFPEGLYKFVGMTFEGQRLESTFELRHLCLPPPKMIPPAELPGVPVPSPDRQIAWEPVVGAVGYELQVFEKATGNELRVRVPAETTQFTIAAGWLRPGSDYLVKLGVISDAGNVTFHYETFQHDAW